MSSISNDMYGNGKYSMIRDIYYVDGHLAIWKNGDWVDIVDSAIVIPDNTDAIEALQALVGNLAVATQITNAIAAIKSELIGEDTDTVDSNTIKGVKKYADNLNSEIDTRMDAVEASIVTLTGADTVEGSIAKALKDAKDYADIKVDSITGGDAGEI